jgi:rhamnosyltransferase
MANSLLKSEIAAVVVLYQPSANMLANIDSYSAQVDRVIAVDNSDQPDSGLHAALLRRGIDYLWMNGNTGIAAALNAGCQRARSLDYAWALTMDQDSTALPLMVQRLAECLDTVQSQRIAIVAPNWQQVGGLPVLATGDCRELDFAMTSGNLLRLATFEDLGGFREDLFIDKVDDEFCLRARQRGWRVVQKLDAVLLHRMGHLQQVTFPLRCYVTNYSPVRRYYMVRNHFEVKRELGKDFPTWLAAERGFWRAKEIIKIALAEPQRLKKLHMMLQGYLDYRYGRFGSYDELHSASYQGAFWLRLRPRLGRLRRRVRRLTPLWQSWLWRHLRHQTVGLTGSDPAASILLVTYNRLTMLRECVSSILANTDGVTYELIVWDNASTDGTRQYLDTEALLHPQLRVIHSSQNVGLNGVAASVRLAHGEYLVEMDDDVLVVPPGWLSEMIRSFKAVPHAGYLAANVVQDETTNGAKPPLDDYLPINWGNGVIIEHGPTGGWCTITSQAVIQSIGNFLEIPGRIYFGEDGDFSQRCVDHHYRIGIVQSVRVYHAAGVAKNKEFGYLEVCRTKYSDAPEYESYLAETLASIAGSDSNEDA